MKTNLKQLFSDSAAFSLALMGNKLVAFLLVPVYTTYLSVQQYGYWDITTSVLLIVTYLSMMGTDVAMAFYYHDAATLNERRRYLSTAIVLGIVLSICYFLIVGIGGRWWLSFLYEGQATYPQILLYAMGVNLTTVVIQHLLAYARYSRRVWVFNSMTMMYVIGSSLASIYFLVVDKRGVEGIFLGQWLWQLVIVVVLLILFRSELTWRLQWRYCKDLLFYGLPLLPTLMSFWVLNSLSRPLLTVMGTVGEAGILGTAVRFASVVALVTGAFQLAWRPFSMSLKDEEHAPRLYSSVARLYLLITTCGILFLSFVIRPIMQALTGDPAFVEGYPIVWMLSLGTVLNTFHAIIGIGLFIRKRTRVLTPIFLCASLLYLGGNLFLIPFWGFWAVGVMTVVTYFLIMVWVYARAQKIYPIDFRIASMLSFLMIYVGLLSFVTWIQVEGWRDAWLYYGFVVLLYISSIFVTRLFRLHSLAQMRKVVQTWMR
ncbi:lipopolysaccharide biosynthesis protein [Mechercharimyces sp. CAU 1602]|uniref:lipopolysaccharide biosynthesis protein n=1 Tax=Mechercharimyces sp. CAU 1602 TaxID=2973933 RepID=UPI0021628701|nr:hypothetical protein [Mechercharimyces sp. CAU 1602]MCS1352251.1 hypothetical protein [Mechercharimyces sp. CAU 1602]